MACNTTSANVYDEYKNSYDYKIYPIIQTSAKIISELAINRLGVFATSATVNSKAYTREINKYNADIKVFEMACPDWVKIVEENKQSDAESVKIIKENLEKMLENAPDKIVLGCTHYPFLLDVLSKFAPKDMFIDPASFFANYIKSDLEQKKLLNSSGGNEEFFVSSNAESFKLAAKMFYELKDKPKLLNLF